MIEEIGNNHNGDLDLAKKLIKIAKYKGFECGESDKTRTCYLQIRNLALYPDELHPHITFNVYSIMV